MKLTVCIVLRPQMVQSIIECAEPELPRTDARGEPFSSEFHQFISSCLKKDVRR